MSAPDLATLGFGIDSRQALSAANDLDRMTASAGRAEGGARRLEGATRDLGTASAGASGSVKRATDEMHRVLGTSRAATTSVQGLVNQMVGVTRASEQALRPTQQLMVAQAAVSGSSNRLTTAMTNASFQVQDFAVQVASGQAATMALAQQLPQLLGAFGMTGKIALFGSLLGTVVALSAAIIPHIDGVGAAVSNMTKQFDQATGAITAVKNGLSFVGDNIDRIVVYTATGAAGWAAYTAAMALANVGTLTLAGSLTFLRGALIRTGIGVLVIGAGELVFQFGRLVKGAGGFGEAMSLLGDVAKGVWQGIGESASAIPDALGMIWQGIRAGFYTLLEGMTQQWANFLHMIAGGLRNAPGMEDAFLAVGGAAISAGSKVYEFGQAAETAQQKASDLAASAGETVVAGFGTAVEALGKLKDATADVDGLFGLPSLKKGMKDAEDGSGRAKKAIDEMTKSADRWKERIEQVGPPIAKYNREMSELTKLHQAGLLTAEEFARGQRLVNDEFADGIPLIGDVADAFGDFFAGGLRDFKGAVSSIVGGFRNMISDMVATAARNRIVIGVTGVGGVAGTAASAATGGAGMGGNLMSGANLLSSLTGFGSSIMSGITAPLQAGVSAAMQNGLSAGFQAWNASANFGASGALGLGAQIGSYLGPAMLGMGLGSVISGGYALGGKGTGTAVTGIGTAIGAAILGPLGGLLGGALGGVANRMFGRKLKDTGIEGNFSTEDGFTGNAFQFYKGGWFRSNKTKRSALDAGVYDTLSDAFGGVEDSVAGMAETLGLATKALDGFNFGFKFSTKGMSGEEITARLQEEMQNAGEKMADLVLATGRYTRASETSLEAMTRLTTSLAGVNSIMDTLGHSFRAAGLAGADMASQLADLFGGLDAMASATEAYYQAFYTEDQRRATATRQMTEQLAKLNVTMPRTREQYMQLVEAQNLSTERGREVYAALVLMAESMNFVLPSVRNFSAEVAALAGTVSTELQTAISGAENAAQTYAQSARLWYQTAASLRTFLRDLNNSNLAFIHPQQALRANQSYFDGLMTKVQGGDVDAAKALSGAAGDLLTSLRQTSRTQAEYAAAAARVTAGLNLAAGISDLEGANDDVTVSLYKEQISVLTSLQNFLQYQGLTEDAIKQLPKDLQAMVRDFDGSLATFDSSLASIEKALKEVSSFSYSALQERLKVNVDLIAKADVPDYIRGMLTAANEGIRSSIDFIIRKDLPPDMKWIAITGQSSMIKSVEALLSGKSSTRAIDLALKDISQRQVAVAAVLSSGMDDKQKRLLDILSGTTKGTLTLGGSFQFDPAKSFSVWYETATKNAITNPISGLRDSLNQLRDAMNVEAKNRASLAMETYFSGLNKGASGTTYVTQADVNKLAGMAGISTAGKSFEQVRDAVANYDKSDAIKNMIRDEDGSKYLAPLKTNVADAFAKLKSTMAKYSVEFNMPSANIKKANGTIDPDYLEKVQLRESWGWKYMLTPQFDSWKAIYNSGIWDSLINANNALIAAQARVPKFAVGGSHAGGLRIVGERGPELEATGPSRIYSSRQTREMFSQDEIVSELKALREENRQLLLALNASNSKTAKTLQKWDRIGQPAEQAATGNAA